MSGERHPGAGIGTLLRAHAAHAALARLQPDARPATLDGACLTAVLGARPGDGATFLSTMVGVQLARSHRTLVVDADFDASPGSAPPLDRQVRGLAPDLRRRLAPAVDHTGLRILPLAEHGRPGLTTPDRALARVLEVFAPTTDHLIVDLGHRADRVRTAALGLVDGAVLVTSLDHLASGEAQAARLAWIAAGLRRSRLWLVVNRVPPGPRFSVDAVRARFGAPVLACLPDDPEAADAWWTAAESTIDDGPASLSDGLSRIATALSG